VLQNNGALFGVVNVLGSIESHIQVHRSNRMESLKDHLLALLSEPAADPMAPEVIAIQSRGMEHYVRRQLAARHGICAHMQFVFPDHLIDNMLTKVASTETSPSDPYDDDDLLWSLAGVLQAPDGSFSHTPLGFWLEQQHTGTTLSVFQLAQQLAQTFRQYLLYRSEMILRWDQGELEPDEPAWQALLWRHVTASLGTHHPARRCFRFLSAFQRGELPPEAFAALPERIILFGMITLPPLYLEVLKALSQHTQVHLYHQLPSSHYLGEAKEHADRPLLDKLGKVPRDFQHQIIEHDIDQGLGADLFEEPTPVHDLGRIQADLFRLQGTSTFSGDQGDSSIQVHSCPTPFREVEALKDNLRKCLEDDETLQPGHILVMVNDLALYEPSIEAVFGREKDDVKLPFHIMDKKRFSGNPVALALLTLLRTLPGRLKASEVLDLLSLAPLAQRFEFSPSDLSLITQWVSESGIRWGRDAPHRQEHGLPDCTQNSWRFGLNRLLLGVTLCSPGHETYQGVLPIDPIEGDRAQLLGRFAQACEWLFTLRDRCSKPMPMADWNSLLFTLCDVDLPCEAGQHVHTQSVKRTLAALSLAAQHAAHTQPVPLDALTWLLEARLEAGYTRSAPAVNKVTFAAPLSMRGVPYRVIAFMGLNHTSFPRRIQAPSFDLVHCKPRPGDRSIQDDDRFLFLEMLLSARDTFIATFGGVGVQDGKPRPPSVVLAALLDTLTPLLASSEKATPEYRVIEHPLVLFHPDMFTGTQAGLFTYSQQAYTCAQAIEEDDETPHDRPRTAINLPGLDNAEPVALAELVRFFRLPSAAFAKQRLGLSLKHNLDAVDDEDPVVLGRLEASQFGRQLIQGALAPSETGSLRATGVLPQGTPGNIALQILQRQAQAIANTAEQHRNQQEAQTLDVDLTLSAYRLMGALSDVSDSGRTVADFKRMPQEKKGAHVHLQFWIEHLALCATREDPARCTSTLVGRDKADGVTVLRFAYVPDAAQHLGNLLELYFAGQQSPLPLFPDASLMAARILYDAPANTNKALQKARGIFAPARTPYADGHDPLVGYLYPDNPIDSQPERFLELAQVVFGPMIESEASL